MHARTSLPPQHLVDELVAKHSRRFPEKAFLAVIGDGGVSIRLPLLLGIPTGAVRPADATAFPAWADLASTSMGGRKAYAAAVLAATRDCLIYPDRGTLAEWEARWPALVDSASTFALQKIGAKHDALRSPLPGEDPPDSITAILAEHPSALWRWIDLGVPSPVVLVPPSLPHWEALQSAIGRADTNFVSLLDDLMTTCAKGPDVSAKLLQWPGLALQCWMLLARAAGANAEGRLGEW